GPAALRNKTYPIRTVLQALTLYNLGYSLNETARRLKSKSVESPDLLEDRLLHRMRERIHASRYHDAAAAECSPVVVVQGAYLRALGDFTLFLCISLTHFNLRRVTGGPSHAGARDRGFPSPF